MGRQPLIGLVAEDYRGQRYVLGRTLDAYALWRAAGGAPITTFPLTEEGWAAAWAAYHAMEEELTAEAVRHDVGSSDVFPRLGAGAAIVTAFRLWAANLRTLLGICAPVVLSAYGLVFALVLSTMEPATLLLDGGETVIVPQIPAWVSVVQNVLLYGFVTPFLTAAIVTLVVRALMGRPTDVRSSYRAAGRRMFSVLWVTFLSAVVVLVVILPMLVVVFALVFASEVPGVMVFLAGLATTVVGVFVTIRLIFSAPIVMVERVRGISALRRSWSLVRGHGWRVLGTFLLLALIMLGVFLLLSLFLAPFLLGRDVTYELVRTIIVVSLGISALLGVFVTPLTNVLVVLLYLDLRGRKEGLTREELEGEAGLEPDA